MELLFPAPLSVSSHPPYHFPPAHDPFHVETSADRQVQSAMQPLPSNNSVQRAMNGAASPVASASQPQTLAPSPLAATPINSTPTSPKRQPHFFLGSSPSKEDSLSRSRHDSSPSATVLSEPRSRASSKARRHGRPGNSADFQGMRSFIPSLSEPRRRALSLDESALPSFRPQNLPDDVPSPYLSFYSSAAPSAEDISDPMPVQAGDPRAESTAMGTTASHSGRTSMEHSILVARRKTWHTLAEVMSTEKGYLNDLRSLVLVYLDQLPNFFQLSEEDYNAVARNARDLLQLHQDLAEEFVQVDADLQAAAYPDFHHHESSPALGRGLNRATRILVANSSRFESYEAYCSGHSEALNVIRNLQARPSEWDAYEQRCATLVSGAVVFEPAIRRRHSTDSMRLFGNHAGTAVNRSTLSRLRLIDFLIKPVQRICKYPLLLSQLQGTMAAANLPSTADADLVSLLGLALGTMKHVVGQVDEARKVRETMIRSSLVLSRVEPHPVLSAPLLETLGPSLLIGSLEVIYHHPVFAPLKAPMRARYYGVFLYPGYIVMAKIKRGKTYDLRQWFPLQGGELVDTPDSQSFLPFTFRFASGLHHFDFIARCTEEKEVWVQAFKQALKGVSTVAPAIANSSSLHPGVQESRIAKPSEQVGLASFLADGLSTADKELGLNDKPSKGPGLSPSRNSMTLPNASPKRRTSLFSSDPLSSTLRRPTASHRLLVDKALADVFSEACMRARSQAVPLGDQTTQAETVSRRPGSWGRASTMLNRTSSVSSMFYRRSGADFRAAGSSSRSSGEDVTEIPRPASSGNIPPNSAGRSMIAFPHHSLSMTRRRAPPVITSATFSVNGQGVLEADEDGNEEVQSPVSTVFPLTPEAAAFQENLASAHSTSSETHEPDTTTNRPPHRRLSTRSTGIVQHTRTKSQSFAQNVRELFHRPRTAVSTADLPSEPPEKVRVVDDQPTGLNPGGYPSTPLLLVPQPSVLQRGLSLIRKRVTSTVSDGMAVGRPRSGSVLSAQPQVAFSKAEMSPSDDDDADSIVSMRGVLASPPRPKSFDITQVNNPMQYSNFPDPKIPIRPPLRRAGTSLATTVLS